MNGVGGISGNCSPSFGAKLRRRAANSVAACGQQVEGAIGEFGYGDSDLHLIQPQQVNSPKSNKIRTHCRPNSLDHRVTFVDLLHKLADPLR